MAVSTGISGGSAEISQQSGGPVVAEFGDGVSVGAVGVRVEVWEADDGTVPAQQLEEGPLPYLVGCLADSVQQLVHGGHCSCVPRHAWLVQLAGCDEASDEVGGPVGLGVGEVEVAAADDGAGGAERVEAVENSRGRG